MPPSRDLDPIRCPRMSAYEGALLSQLLSEAGRWCFVSDFDSRVPPRYRQLHEWLMSHTDPEVSLSIPEIEEMIGVLPNRAWSDRYWWRSTPRNAWARAWLLAGREAVLNVSEGSVVFVPWVFKPIDPEAVRAGQLMGRNYAAGELAWPPSAFHIQLRWWEGHFVYIIHIPEDGLYKVGVTRRNSSRLQNLTARGRATVMALLPVANLWAAKLVEFEVLEVTRHAQRVGDPFTYLNGQYECWDDSFAPPDVVAITELLATDPALVSWSVSQSRDESEEDDS